MAQIPFEDTKEQRQKLLDSIERHKAEKGAVMSVLHDAQDIYGYVPEEVQRTIAEGLGVSLAEVYGVVTFYSRFSLQPKGRHQVSVCLGTACYVKGSAKILEKVEEELGIKCGECAADRSFSLDSCRCVGACSLAPVMIVDGEVYGKMTPDKVKEVLDKYREA